MSVRPENNYWKDEYLYNTFQTKSDRIRTDLKICWFVITQPALQETCRSQKIFNGHSLKIFFSQNILF